MKPYEKPLSPQEYLMHYGVKGMKWGVRRYQNYDGSYTRNGIAKRSRTTKPLSRKQTKPGPPTNPVKLPVSRSRMPRALLRPRSVKWKTLMKS